MLKSEEQVRDEVIFSVAKKMMAAARTAPKGRGTDNMEICLVDKETIREISEKMKHQVEEAGWMASFERDAENILLSPYMVLLGTKISPMQLGVCGMCGFPSCEEKEKHPDVPCVFNTGDLGIAIGSAVSIAMDHRIDNRIMYTVGQAVKLMGLMSYDMKIIYGIPLSISSKNPFFDRK